MRLARDGYNVVLTSHRRQRLYRLVDIVGTLLAAASQIDVQILQVYSGPSFVAEDIASLVGVLCGHKIVMHLHGGALPAFMERYPHWSRRVLRRASAIVTPSAFLQRALASFGLNSRVIPNALDLPEYPYRHRVALAPRLFWMRAFHDVYNPEMAVRVLSRIRQVEPQATLTMAGQQKGAEVSVKRLARELHVEHAIEFPGFLDFADKIRTASSADIFLNTNRIDNAPVSVIEACAMGLPVVATKVGGIADLLTDRETALLVPDGDDRAMADAVLELLRDRDLAGRLSASGRRMAERFSWNETKPQWERLFAELVSVRDPTKPVYGVG
jgi:glycosyltransferase involved in cell wall biosynthesis